MPQSGVDIDEVLKSIGQFGHYQRKVYTLLCIPILFVGALNFSYVFIAAKPDYRCRVPICDHGKQPAYNTSFLSFTIPVAADGSYDSCNRFLFLNQTASLSTGTISAVTANLTSSSFHDAAAAHQTGDQEKMDEQCSAEQFSKKTWEDCPEGHVFDRTIYESTIITEFDLTCDSEWEAHAVQSVYFGGMLCGAFICGIIADWLGRRMTIVLNLVLLALTGIATALVPNLIMFNIMRFFSAFSSTGVFQTAFVLGLEFIGPKYRVLASMLGQYVFSLGEVLLGCLGLYFRGWRMLQLVLSAPLAAGILYWFIVPESPRWLQSKGRHQEVLVLMRKVASDNKKQLPELLFAAVHHSEVAAERQQLPTVPSAHAAAADGSALSSSSDDDDIIIPDNSASLVSSSSGATGSQRHNNRRAESFLDLVQTPLLCLRLVAMVFTWIVVTLVYYALSFDSAELTNREGVASPNRPYINFMLSAVMEIPGYTLGLLLQQSLGRRPALGLSLLLAGLSCAGAGAVYKLPPSHSLAASLVGKVGITSAFGIIYLYTAEIFPTSSRNTVLGLCSTVARLGGMVAPFTDVLKKYYKPLPLLLFGVLSLLCVLTVLLQPETRGTKLPDTVQEALALGSGSSDLPQPEEERDALLEPSEDEDDDDDDVPLQQDV